MAKIHETAYVESGAELADDVEIGANVIIGPSVKIGRGSKVLANAVVEGNTTIGENNTIGYFAIIGGAPQDLKYKGEPTQLIIGNNNSIREYTTFNTGTVGGGGVTKIGNDNLFMAYCHVAHDCIVNNNVIMANMATLAGHVELEDWVILSGNVSISQYLRIGKHAYIGGCSAVDKDIVPFSSSYGNRISIKGLNLVGLKRRGFTSEDIRALIDAHKIYFEQGKEKALAVVEIKELFPDNEHVGYFVDFIENSRSGIAR